MLFPWAVESLPALIHLSLFLFFAGIVVFLHNVNHGVYRSVVWWIGLFSTLYGCITFLPIIQPESPYYTPLSKTVFVISYPFRFVILGLISVIACFYWIAKASCATLYRFFINAWTIICSCGRPAERYRVGESDADANDGMRNRFEYRQRRTSRLIMWFLQPLEILGHLDSVMEAVLYWPMGMSETAEERRSPEIDVSILNWTIDALDEDDALERFFVAIPGFVNSKLAKLSKVDSASTFGVESRLQRALDGFLQRALSTNYVIESVINRRLDIYLNAMNAIDGRDRLKHAWSMLRWHFSLLPKSIETADTLVRWCASNDDSALHARCLVAGILQSMQRRDDRWIVLARDQLGLPEQVLRDHIARGDNSVLLAIFLHMSRQLIDELTTHNAYNSSNCHFMPVISEFDIYDTLPELQNEFCTLWNEIVPKVDMQHPLDLVLHMIRPLYSVLHPGTDASFPHPGMSYSLCDVPGHRLHSPLHVHFASRPLPASTLDMAASPTDSPRSPDTILALRSSSLPTLLPSAGDTTVTQADRILHTPGPPSPSPSPSSPTARLSGARGHDPPILMDVLRRSPQSVSSAADIAGNTAQPDDPPHS
jgi:hypothetical protein